MRKEFIIFCFMSIVAIIGGYFVLPAIYFPIHTTISVILAGIIILGLRDLLQTRHTILRNFPILGHFRYILESVRPEIQQYFIEGNTDGRPFNREDRSVVYQRAKKQLDTIPFGTQRNVYEPGYQWVNHSMLAHHLDSNLMRVMIGGKDCRKPYSASILNISAMSYGSLSANAIEALNGGAKIGSFAHNTGEGGISDHHLKNGGDLIWQIGTGYFGCRRPDGTFDEQMFKQNAHRDEVKMIEIKISQGAKPGHGGILPAQKISPEIAKIRGVPLDKDVISPPAHSTFSTPKGLCEFIKRLRELSGSKPVGFKLCIGKRREFMAICKAMCETGIYPDFIAVDGGEGGTGAAPLEFSNYVGTPGLESLIFVHNCLIGFGLRKEIKVISSGKIASGFDMIKRMCAGADVCYSARSMMLALGCIQALRCNSNLCPAGVATNDPHLEAGLVVKHKKKRVANFQVETVRSFSDMLGAMGLNHCSELRPWHLMTRVSSHESKHLGELFGFVEEGDFLDGKFIKGYEWCYQLSSSESFYAASELIEKAHIQSH